MSDFNISTGVSLREFMEEKFAHVHATIAGVRTDVHDVNAKADQILKKQDITNGRVRASEKAIAVLQVIGAVGTFLAAAVFAYLLDRVGRP